MRKCCLALLFLMFCAFSGAQQSLNNDSVIKLIQGGLPDDLVITSINASPGIYDTSAGGLTALKSAGVSEKVIAAIVAKAATPAKVAPAALPPMRLGLCAFSVYGSSKSGNAAPIVAASTSLLGLGFIVDASGKHGAYYNDIKKEVQHLYETTFGEDARYQVVSSDMLLGNKSTWSFSMEKIAQENSLYACVSASPSWAAQTGKNIRAVVTTNWEVASPSGCTVTFMTSASSSETYEKLPNGGDPAMHSVYLGLSKLDAKKFLENLPWEMKKAVCKR